jgi:DNA (cytosine-5)-methyltransferase 1
VFFVCGPSERDVAQVLFEPEGGARNFAEGEEAGAEVAASLRSRSHGVGVNEPGRGDGVNLVIGIDVRNLREQPDGLSGTLQSKKSGGYSLNYQNPVMVSHPLSAEGHDASEDGTGRGTPLVFDPTQITSDKNYSNPKAGDPCHPLAEQAHPPIMVHRQTIRRLTPTECEILQGFPQGWTCLCQPIADYQPNACRCPDSPRYRALGNAVTVPVLVWILGRMVTAKGR